jgi:hypothetical protein
MSTMPEADPSVNGSPTSRPSSDGLLRIADPAARPPAPPGCHGVCGHYRRGGRDCRWLWVLPYIRCPRRGWPATERAAA